MALFQDFPEIALNMHESKAPPMGQSHVTKSELLPHPPPSTCAPERGEVGLNIDRRTRSCMTVAKLLNLRGHLQEVT